MTMHFNRTDSPEQMESKLIENMITVTILSLICLIGIIGNVAALAFATRKRNYKLVTNCYIINLSLTDLVFLVICVPITVYVSLTNKSTPFDFINCHFLTFMTYVPLQATCLTISAMSIDRYFYVISSHPRPRWRTPLHALIVCVLIWIVSFILVYPYASFLSSQLPKNVTNNCSLSTSDPIFLSCFVPLCAYYFLPLTIIVLSYTRLCFHMRKVSNNLTQYVGNTNNRYRLTPRQHRVTRTLLSLTCAFAICWFPIHLLELLNCGHALDKLYGKYRRLLDALRTFAHALSYFNFCLNPILYPLYDRDFI